MFIQIRGTFGSGKTTVVKGLIKRFKKLGGKEKMVKYAGVDFAHEFTGVEGSKKPIIVLGRYSDMACSGADSLSWKGVQAQIHAFVREKIRTHHVILEGVMSHSGKYILMAQEFEKDGIRARFFSMSTPLAKCHDRVMSRRRKRWIATGCKGELKPLNPVSQTGHFNAVKSLHEKTLAAGLKSEFIQSTEADIDNLLGRIVK
jgi:hypothetical protein